jgi:hypothetical protein
MGCKLVLVFKYHHEAMQYCGHKDLSILTMALNGGEFPILCKPTQELFHTCHTLFRC